MMDSRENVDKFLVAVRLHQQKDSDFDFDDVLGVLSHEELCSLWSSLQKYTADCIFSLLTTPSTENLMQQDPGPRWSTTIQQPSHLQLRFFIMQFTDNIGCGDGGSVLYLAGWGVQSGAGR